MTCLSTPLDQALFRVTDLETTGLDPNECGVCEIAWRDVTFAGEEETLIAQGCLVNPGLPIPPEASAVHHIVDSDVVDARSLARVLPAFLKPADGFPGTVFVAHNAEFEQSFLPDAGPWLCTFRLALHLWPSLASHGLQYLRYALPLSPDISRSEPVHRAKADVAVTLPLLQRALREALVKWPEVETVGDLIAKVDAPALLDRVPFKSSGYIRFEEAETSLLWWILEKQAGGPDCVHTARHWIDARGPDYPDELPF